MTPVMRARSAADLIAVIPALLGFHPRESLVAIAVHRPRQRLGFLLRVDLPPQEHVDDVAAQVVSYLQAQQPDEILLVAFADGPDRADPVVRAVLGRVAEESLEVADAVRCDGSRHWSYVCTDSRCCPPEGTPYEADSSALLAEAVYHGVEVLPDRQALVERFAPVDGRARADMVDATGRVRDRMTAVAGVLPRDRDPDLLRTGLDVVGPIVDAFERDPTSSLTDDDVAILSAWTSLIVVRDVLWARITRDNADCHLRMWRQVSARVVPPFEPPALSLAAFAAWLSGSGSQAQCALDRVAAVDPTYSMAGLVQSALSRCLPPHTWQGLDPGEVMRTVPGLE